MNNFSYKPVYQRRLPHLQPSGATFFVTFRLVHSIPQIVIKRWKTERQALNLLLDRLSADEAQKASLEFARKRFVDLEGLLDTATTGEAWLKDKRLAQQVCRFLQNKDGEQYRLDA